MSEAPIPAKATGASTQESTGRLLTLEEIHQAQQDAAIAKIARIMQRNWALPNGAPLPSQDPSSGFYKG